MLEGQQPQFADGEDFPQTTFAEKNALLTFQPGLRLLVYLKFADKLNIYCKFADKQNVFGVVWHPHSPYASVIHSILNWNKILPCIL